jgi:hypothetical protein
MLNFDQQTADRGERRPALFRMLNELGFIGKPKNWSRSDTVVLNLPGLCGRELENGLFQQSLGPDTGHVAAAQPDILAAQ